MMTALIMHGATGVITVIMIDAMTHAMTAITIVVTRGDILTDIIGTDITMTDTPAYGARIETATQIDYIAATARGRSADSKKTGPAAGRALVITNHQRGTSCPARLELIVH
jgi:hypothetical protein